MCSRFEEASLVQRQNRNTDAADGENHFLLWAVRVEAPERSPLQKESVRSFRSEKARSNADELIKAVKMLNFF